MRQADSTIKGYLYQFNKSIYEILNSKDDEIVTLEDAVVEHCHWDKECQYREVKWLNIPSHHIKAFTFKCCG